MPLRQARFYAGKTGSASACGRRMMSSGVGLRHRDFLTVPGRLRQWTQPPATRHPGSRTGFAGHPCPAIAGYPAEQQENLLFLRKTPEGIMRRPHTWLRYSPAFYSAVRCDPHRPHRVRNIVQKLFKNLLQSRYAYVMITSSK